MPKEKMTVKLYAELIKEYYEMLFLLSFSMLGDHIRTEKGELNIPGERGKRQMLHDWNAPLT